MTKRPNRISIVAWLLIVLSFLFLVDALQLLSKSMLIGIMPWELLPVSERPMAALQLVVSWMNPFALIITGIFLLKRKNWSRYLYIVWGVIYIAVNYIVLPIMAAWLFDLFMLITLAGILFLPKSNAYFLQETTA